MNMCLVKLTPAISRRERSRNLIARELFTQAVSLILSLVMTNSYDMLIVVEPQMVESNRQILIVYVAVDT